MIAWLRNPELARRGQRLGELLRFETSLEPHLTELAILVCGRHWTSHHEWTAHKRLALAAGLDPRTIADIAARVPPYLRDERERDRLRGSPLPCSPPGGCRNRSTTAAMDDPRRARARRARRHPRLLLPGRADPERLRARPARRLRAGARRPKRRGGLSDGGRLGQAGLARPTRRGAARSRRSRSSTRTTTSSTGRACATCSTTISPTCGPAMTCAPRSSCRRAASYRAGGTRGAAPRRRDRVRRACRGRRRSGSGIDVCGRHRRLCRPRVGRRGGAGAGGASRGRRRPLPRDPPHRRLGPGREPAQSGLSDDRRDARQPGLPSRASAICGASALAFDAWVYAQQLPRLAALARALPDLRIVVDHCGGVLGIGRLPGGRGGDFRALARRNARAGGMPERAR